MRNHDDAVVIAGSARTAIGSFQGALSALRAPDLGARAIAAALERSGLVPGDIDEVLMGCVLPAGVGQAPARQAALLAGVPDTVPATTVNKVCGSGMKTVMVAHDALVAGTIDVAVAGGMESMSNAPYLVAKARAGLRLGHAPLQDHMFLDGLEDAYGESTRGRLMGTFAEDTARHFGFTRADQDDFACESLLRARRANEDGTFAEEIAPLMVAHAVGRSRGRARRAAVHREPRQDPDAEARVRSGRQRDRGQLELDLRRRRRVGTHAPVRGGTPTACRRLRESSVMRPMPESRVGSRRRPFTPSISCSVASAGKSATSTCGRSTRPSPSSRWRPSAKRICRETAST